MPKIPFPTKKKDELPAESKQLQVTPSESGLTNIKPGETPKLNIVPKESEQKEETPDITPEKEDTPDPSPEKEEKPSDLNEENCVVVNGEKIEIKPTKLKYFRNKAASGYNLIKAVPLQEFLTYGRGTLDEKRDADQLLYDFLVAAFDSSEFVRDNYDDMDADVIDRVCKIFGRLNHIDEKEEAARKNREAQAKR